MRYFARRLLGIKQIVATPPIDPVVAYIATRKQKFLGAKESANIAPAFYDKAGYATITCDNNHLETQWKARLMYEPTPRGSVIMFYDVFRQGFAYYCDTNCVPYSVLNAAAMKYVGVFFCRDFFFDDDGNSPLYPIYYPEDKKMVRAPGASANSAQFAKMRNYKLEKDQVVQKTSIKNKFIYLGKFSNLGVLQKRRKQGSAFGTPATPPFLMQAAGNPLLSYSDYKAHRGAQGGSPLFSERAPAHVAFTDDTISSRVIIHP